MKTSKALVKKQLTLVALVVALALAVYLNWQFAKTDRDNGLVQQVLAGQTGQTEPAAPVSADGESGEADSEPQGEPTDKYYGEALFVSAEEEYAEGYFAEARLTRSQTRDEALETLEKALSKTDLTEAEKNNLTAQLTSTASSIAMEGAAETQIKAKGFADCVVFLSGDKVKAVVKAPGDGLSAAEVSQIKEVLIDACGVEATNINIVEIK